MMARALISEDRVELGRLNPLIGGNAIDTLEMVRDAVAFIGHGANHAGLLDHSALAANPAACRGEALLAQVIDVALRFEIAELSVVVVKAVPQPSVGMSSDYVAATAKPNTPSLKRGK
jgi:hypothetical protein